MLEMTVVENATASKPERVMKTPVKKSNKEKRGEYRPPALRPSDRGLLPGQVFEDKGEGDEVEGRRYLRNVERLLVYEMK